MAVLGNVTYKNAVGKATLYLTAERSSWEDEWFAKDLCSGRVDWHDNGQATIRRGKYR